MRRVAAMVGTAAVVLMTASVFAQTPNFAGTWTVDAEKTAAANPNMAGGGGRGGGRGGGPMTIKQDAKTLTITRTTQAGPTDTVYNLDGTESRITMAGRGGSEAMTVVAKAKWDGAKLTITTGQNVAVYAMDGAWLTIATTRPGRGGGEATTTTLFYKKAM